MFSEKDSIVLDISVIFIGSTLTVSKNSPETKPLIAFLNFDSSRFILFFWRMN